MTEPAGEPHAQIITASQSGVVLSDPGGAPTSVADVGRTLFSVLSHESQVAVVLWTYGVSLSLGVALSLLSFYLEYQAQTHHLAFEMRDWMVGLLFALLSLPVVGATVWGTRKK